MMTQRLNWLQSLQIGMIVSAAINLLLIGIGLWTHPETLSGKTGLGPIIIPPLSLVGYVLVSLWATHLPGAAQQIALKQGTLLGILLGLAQGVNICLESLVDLGTTLNTILGVGMWGLMFLLFAVAGSATYRQLNSLPLAVLAGLWSALVGILITLVFGFAINLIFMAHMQQTLEPDFLQSGLVDPGAFVVLNMLASALSHLVLAPILAIGFAGAGAVAQAGLRTVGQRGALICAGLGVALLSTGLTALYISGTLARSQRPPFVLSGLLALALALILVHPILSLLRSQPPQTR